MNQIHRKMTTDPEPGPLKDAFDTYTPCTTLAFFVWHTFFLHHFLVFVSCFFSSFCLSRLFFSCLFLELSLVTSQFSSSSVLAEAGITFDFADVSGGEHDAAYDAYLTGVLFAAICQRLKKMKTETTNGGGASSQQFLQMSLIESFCLHDVWNVFYQL